MAAKEKADSLTGEIGLRIQRERSDCSALADKINAELELAVGKKREVLEHLRCVGETLLQVKAAVGHGAYRAWIETHCVFTHRTAERYTRLVKNWKAITEKSDTVSHLTMRGALKLVASTGNARPQEPDDGVRVPDDVGVQIQVLACLMDAWDEATQETRLDFLTTLHGHGELMPVINESARRGAA